MKRGAILPGLALLTLLAFACSCAKAGSRSDADPFLGRWDITLQTPEREFASWLEISQDNGELRARMVGRWGHARVLPRAEIVNGAIRLVSPKEEEGTMFAAARKLFDDDEREALDKQYKAWKRANGC